MDKKTPKLYCDGTNDDSAAINAWAQGEAAFDESGEPLASVIRDKKFTIRHSLNFTENYRAIFSSEFIVTADFDSEFFVEGGNETNEITYCIFDFSARGEIKLRKPMPDFCDKCQVNFCAFRGRLWKL